MQKAGRLKTGFTIVELLIVIVVIAILAAITIVAFNGVQTRAENTKTTSAVVAWAKALQLYKVDNGAYPTTNSCLGATTTYQGYNGRCWAPDTSGWTVNSTFNNTMAPYLQNLPEPSSRSIESDTTQYRGAIFYHVAPNDVRVYVNFFDISQCPELSGLNPSYANVTRAKGMSCYYRLPG